jgi:hypothetical protein
MIDYNDPFQMVFPPLAHQAEEYYKHRDDEIRGLFWEPGCGKSKPMVDTIAYHYLGGRIDTVIIMAKKGEYSNWAYVELPTHMPKEVDYVCEVWKSALKSHEKEAFRQLVVPQNRLRILNINIEAMSGNGLAVARVFAKSRRKGLLFLLDESTCAKSTTSSRAKEVYKLRTFASYKRILTGTPITRNPMDLWGQGQVLGNNCLGHSNYYSFKEDYAVEKIVYLGQRHFKQISGFKNLDRLQKQVKTFASIKTRAECLDLPPKIYKKVAVPLTDRQQELYVSMKEMAIAELSDGEIVNAVNALNVISKLDQIACGQIKREDGTHEIIESNRPEMLMDRLSITDKKKIIWCNYKGLLEFLYEKIRAEFGDKHVGRFYGGVPEAEREATIKSYQEDDNGIKFIVANQQSMGFGRTLTRGKENYYYSNGYNLEFRLQSEDRTMRIGQDEAVTYDDFYSPGTVNEKIFTNLREKKDLAHAVLGTKLTAWI